MKTGLSPASHGDYRGFLYEALTKSKPVHSARSPYKTRGVAYCTHCGMFAWEDALQMKHGAWYHVRCGRKVRLRPFPSILERLQRKKPKRHY